MKFNSTEQRDYNLKAPIKKWDSSNMVIDVEYIPQKAIQTATVKDCLTNGYAPIGYKVKDFSIVQYKGKYHLFHIPAVDIDGIYCHMRGHENWIAHAISDDLDTWYTEDAVLFSESGNEYESSHVWAPYVIIKNDTAFMFYTGLTQDLEESICLATSVDPELKVWTKYPDNPLMPREGFDWHWRNKKSNIWTARDHHVIKVEDHFLMAYTCIHKKHIPAVGGMVSEDLFHWEDIGPMFYRDIKPGGWMPESVNIQPLSAKKWVLMPSASPGIEYAISETPYSWHGSTAQTLDFIDRVNETDYPGGIEIISRNDDSSEWLVAFFNKKRLHFGILDYSKNPWSLEKFKNKTEINKFIWR